MSAESGRTARVDRWVGRLLADRYEIAQPVGQGGMSTVYRAIDTSLGRTVAIKLFRPELAGADDLRRQRDEVRMLASLNHPTLVTLFDAASTDDGQAFLVLEYVDGQNLRTTMEVGALDPARVAVIGADVADAIGWVHHRGIVHRDIKPANVLIPRHAAGPSRPHALLADFGIARLLDGTRMTSTGSVIGTASYLSPEQASGTSTGAATDVYSLGLVLLECLTATRTFGGSGIESVVARLTRDPEIPASLGSEWVRLLSLMTRRSPDERPSASEVSAWLRTMSLGTDAGTERTMLLPATDETAPMPAPADPSDRARPGDGTATEVIRPERTAVLTGAADDATERLHDPPRPEPTAEPATGRRRGFIIAGTIAAVLIVASIAANGVISAGQPAETDVDYPVVEGDLGEHLEQLQRSVER